MHLFNSKEYELYNELITGLYNCHDIKELQSLLLHDLHQLVPSDNAILIFYEEDGITAQSSVLHRLDTSLFSQYQDYYQQFDEYKNIVHNLDNLPVVNRASDYLDYKNWEHNEHRSDFLLPQNIYHMACLEIIENDKILTSISLHRNRKQKNFSDRETNILYILVPIIKRVYISLTSFPHLTEITTDLTAREREILPLLVSRLSTQELADYFGITINTIKTHIKNILRKLNCSSRTDILFLLHRAGGYKNEIK